MMQADRIAFDPAEEAYRAHCLLVTDVYLGSRGSLLNLQKLMVTAVVFAHKV